MSVFLTKKSRRPAAEAMRWGDTRMVQLPDDPRVRPGTQPSAGRRARWRSVMPLQLLCQAGPPEILHRILLQAWGSAGGVKDAAACGRTCKALHQVWSGSALRSALCSYEGLALRSAGKEVAPGRRLESSWACYYALELSVLPGGMRRCDLFAVATPDELRSVLQLEFCRARDKWLNCENLLELLHQGLDVRLSVVTADGCLRATRSLHDLLRFKLRGGALLRFELLQDGQAAPDGSKVLGPAQKLPPAGVLWAPSCYYRPLIEGPRAGADAVVPVITVESMVDKLLVIQECGGEGAAELMEELRPELEHIDLAALGPDFVLPNQTGWPSRPPQRPLVFLDDEIEYGDNDLEGIRDSEGENFWVERYEKLWLS